MILKIWTASGNDLVFKHNKEANAEIVYVK